MYSSAIRSSSRISTPGSRCSATTASVSARSAPARAMPSISDSDLRTIIGRPTLGFHLRVSLDLLERLLDLVEDGFHGAVRVDADDVGPGRAVVVDERRRLALVEIEAPPARMRRVVGPVLLGAAAQPPLQPRLLVGRLEVDPGVELAAKLAEAIVGRLG